MTINIITLNKDGNSYTDFKSFEIKKSLETASGYFRFEASSTDNIADFPFKAGDPVEVAIDGENVITGYIDAVSPSANPENHTITIEGRDKIQDIIDSKIEAKTVNVPISMVNLIKVVLEAVGYVVVRENKKIGLKNNVNEIAIINNAGIIEDFKEKIDLRSGESGWNLIRKYAEKRQLVINANGDGNIVINKIGVGEASTIIQNFKNNSIGIDSQNNNVKNVNFSIDLSKRFNKYIVKSNNTTNPEEDGDGYQFGEAFDDEIRSTRVLLEYAALKMTSADCKKRAQWEANVRKANSIKYDVALFGFRQNLKEELSDFSNNPLWQINQLVIAVDSFNGIDDELLIKSVLYSKTRSEGSTTTLELIDKLAYSTTLNEPLLRKGKAEVGGILFQNLGLT